MAWWLILPFGIIGGIIFAVGNPETADAINEAVLPTLQTIADKLKELAIDFIKREIL